jgi:phosphate transport system substrate-binding protein
MRRKPGIYAGDLPIQSIAYSFIIQLFNSLIRLFSHTRTQASDPYQGTITVSGAFALYPMMQRWAEEFHNLHPGVKFDISAGGAGKGMTDVLSGAVDIGMISRDITSDEMTKGAYGIAVTKDAVFPTINMNNPLARDIFTQGITRDTLIKIFIAGEVSN